MNNTNDTLNSVADAAKGLAQRLGHEAANAAQLDDIRIDTSMVNAALGHAANLLRHDVPRKAYL